MSDLDEDLPRRRSGTTGGVWGLAAFSAAVFLCSVLAAKLLAQMVDEGEFDRLAVLRRVPSASSEPQVYSVVRSVGVDSMTTATIPHRGPAPLSPCGDAKK